MKRCMGFHALDGEVAAILLGFLLFVLGGEHRHLRDILEAVVHAPRQLLDALHGGGRDGPEGQPLALHILAEDVYKRQS